MSHHPKHIAQFIKYVCFNQLYDINIILLLIWYERKQKEANYDIVTGTRYAHGGGVSMQWSSKCVLIQIQSDILLSIFLSHTPVRLLVGISNAYSRAEAQTCLQICCWILVCLTWLGAIACTRRKCWRSWCSVWRGGPMYFKWRYGAIPPSSTECVHCNKRTVHAGNSEGEGEEVHNCRGADSLCGPALRGVQAGRHWDRLIYKVSIVMLVLL